MRTVRFDGTPEVHVEDGGATGVVEGLRDGDTLQLRASYANNPYYVSSGEVTAIRATLTVAFGLRGATPKLVLTQKDLMAPFFSGRFHVDGGPEADAILDDDTKRALVEWVVLTPLVEKIEVTARGLEVLLPASDAAVRERTIALAHRLQGRILDVLEERVRAAVTAAGYRG